MARSYQGRMAWMPSLRMAAWRRLLNLRFARQRCWGYQQPGAQDCPSGAETRSNVRLPPMFWCFGIPGFGQGHVSWAKATRHHLANGFCPKSIHAVKGLDLVGFLFRCSTQYFSTSFHPHSEGHLVLPQHSAEFWRWCHHASCLPRSTIES